MDKQEKELKKELELAALGFVASKERLGEKVSNQRLEDFMYGYAVALQSNEIVESKR